MHKGGLKIRVIPVLLLRNGILVRSREFRFYQVTGNPYVQVDRFNAWNVDELIYLDISRSGRVLVEETGSVIGATSSKKQFHEKPPSDIYEFVEYVSRRCFMPLCFGGGIQSVEQIRRVLLSGADKVVINTYAFKAPELISQAAEAFGSQCVVVSIDCRKTGLGYEVFVEGGKTATGKTAIEWALEAERQGAGELLINSIDRDGTGQGYDTDLYRPVIDSCRIPVIICGGVGRLEHFSSGFNALHPHALAAANIFHFIEHSDRQIKKHLAAEGINVRLYHEVTSQ